MAQPSSLDLQGSLAHTSVADVLQFLHIGSRTGALRAIGPDESEGVIWIQDGELCDARFGEFAGLDALALMIPWRDGHFWFANDEHSTTVSIDASLTSCLMQAAQKLDELRREQTGASEDPLEMCRNRLEEFIDLTEADLVMVLNGAGLENLCVGDTTSLDQDGLAASFKEMMSGAAFIASVLKCENTGEIILELDQFEVILVSAGRVRMAVVAPSTARLGVIRHRSKRLAEDLREIIQDEEGS